jgi:L,D-peptidoglycan transpeptidase YkuD (ErfK/YbiS/YcfS/YnhG family)
MPYRRIGHDDIWVTDPDSPDYNQWRKMGEAKALYFEEMRRPDSLYEIGVVIGYNRNPAVRNLGSAIFFHVWRGKCKATSGCVALALENLLKILSWLEPLKHPMAVLGV